jgi:hypothetical protein
MGGFVSVCYAAVTNYEFEVIGIAQFLKMCMLSILL